MYRAHTMSATIMPIHLKDGTYLQTTYMKYDQYRPRIQGVNVHNILFHIFFSVKSNEKAHCTENLPQYV